MHATPRLLLAALIAAPIFAAGTVSAALVTVLNPSFESPATAAATFTGTTTTGPANWTVYNTGATDNTRFFGVWNPATTVSYIGGAAPHGANVGVVFLDNTTDIAEAGLQQVLAATLQLGTQYTLTVAVGNFSPGDPGPWDFTGFPGYRVDLLAGSTLLASDNNTLAPGEGIFLTSTVSFTTGGSHAAAGQPLRIRLVNLNGPGVEVNFDTVQLDAAVVPEPASAVLCGIGALCALARRRR